MATDFSTKNVLVVDHGLFLPLARRLAQEFGRVYYYTPWEKSWPVLNEGCVGGGFDKVLRVDDIWRLKDQVDLFVFPDLYHAGLQAELRSQGKRVWGAGAGMRLEIDRQFFNQQLKDLDLPVAPHKVIMGLTNLAAYLKEAKDKFIKVSKWRGSWETEHWRSWQEDRENFDIWAVQFGAFKEHIPFLVFDKIETKLEIGADTYCIGGKWPAKMLHGIEQKDEAYFSAVTDRAKMPADLTRVMDAFSPFLAQVGYASQWSMEVRLADDAAYFIDATTRGGLPSSASFISSKNLGDVVWHGADGDLVEIDYGFKFSAEVMVKIKGDKDTWASIVVPDQLVDHLKLFGCCYVDDKVWFPADRPLVNEIGWLCATGDSPKEVAAKINEYADQLPDGVNACVESLADVLREIETEQEAGIHFTDQPIPDPAVVLEPS